ncbi:MAG: hypothetical protein KF768_13450 [Phycisphaeraceae bacterium]|nr:hypothetical protein [Phycisphaeraceae bacterium]
MVTHTPHRPFHLHISEPFSGRAITRFHPSLDEAIADLGDLAGVLSTFLPNGAGLRVKVVERLPRGDEITHVVRHYEKYGDCQCNVIDLTHIVRHEEGGE